MFGFLSFNLTSAVLISTTPLVIDASSFLTRKIRSLSGFYKASLLLRDVSEPTDATYNLDRAYCYFCTSILGAFLRILSYRKLADQVLITCLCYNSSELCRLYFR
jgi:hypothetical protein